VKKIFSVIAILSLVFFPVTPAFASAPETYVWTGAGADTNILTNANWDQGHYPGAITDNITFASGGVTATDNSTNFQMASITFDSDVDFSITSGRVDSFLQINAGGITAENNVDGDRTYTVSQDVTLGASQTWTVSNGGLDTTVLSISGAIGDGGHSYDLTKDDDGTLTLSGANTYTGDTTVNGGTLNLDYSTQDNSKLSDTGVLVLGGGALDLTGGSHTEVVASTMFDPGASSVTRSSGTSVLQMNALSSAIGSTVNFGAAGIATTDKTNTNGILGGWATVGGTDWAMNSTNGADGAITAYADYTNDTWSAAFNTTVTNNAFVVGSTTNSLRFNAAGAFTLTLTGTNTIFSGGILVTSAVGNNLSTITGGTLQGASGEDLVVIQNNTSNGLTIGSVIQDNTSATSLTKSGAGTLTLTGTNTYTGTTYVNEGTLTITDSNALGNTDGVEVADGGILQLDSNGGDDIVIGDVALTLYGPSGYELGALNSVAGDNSWAGDITLTGNAGVDAASGSTLVLTGDITGDYNFGKFGEGELTLSGNNTYTGITKLTSGILNINSDTALGTGGLMIHSGTTIDNTSGGLVTLENNNAQAWQSDFTFTGTNALDLGTGDVDISSAPVTITVQASTLTVGGIISDDVEGVSQGHSLTKTGEGTLTLSGANTYTGATTIESGKIIFNNSLTTSAINFSTGSTGTAEFADGAGVTYDITNSTTNQGAVTFDDTLTTRTVSGNIGSTGAGVNQVNVGIGTTVFNGNVNTTNFSFAGNGGFVQVAAGKSITTANAITVSNNSASSIQYLGTTTISQDLGAAGGNRFAFVYFDGGTVTLDANIYTSNASWADAATVVTSATVNLTGDRTIGGKLTLKGDGSITGAGQTLTVDGGGSYDMQSGTVSAILDGAVDLTKTTAGTVTLSGANIYTGTTTVNEGTMNLDFSAADTDSDIINSSSALVLGGGNLLLTGKDEATNSQTVSGLTLNAGHSEITLTAGASNLLVLNLGDIVNNDGATVNFTLPTGDQDLTNGITTTTANDASGILGVWATVTTDEGSDWAVKDAEGTDLGNIRAMSDEEYIDIPAYGGIILDVANNNVRIKTDGDLLDGDITLEYADTTVNTLLQDNADIVAKVNIDGGTLRTNGIMIDAYAENLVIGDTDFDLGTLTAAYEGGDLVLSVNNPDSILTVNSIIADNGDAASSLIKSGDGTVDLNGENTYTGDTIISEGTLNLGESLTESSGLIFAGDATVNLTSNRSIECPVTTEDDGSGTLAFEGNGEVTGTLGADGAYLKAINVAQGYDYGVSLDGDVYVNQLNFGAMPVDWTEADGTDTNIYFDGDVIVGQGNPGDGITTEWNEFGVVEFDGNATINGDIGENEKALWQVWLDGAGTTLTLNGDVYQNVVAGPDAWARTTIYFNNDNQTIEVAAGKTIGADIATYFESPTENATLTFLGSATVTGDIGYDSWGAEGIAPLDVVNLQGDSSAVVTMNGDLYANDVYVGAGNLEMNGNLTTTFAATLTFTDDGEVILGDGYTITSNITTEHDNQGTLTFDGDGTVDGQIGGALLSLKAVTLDGVADTTVTITGDIYATDLYVGDGTLELNGSFFEPVTPNATLIFTGDGEVKLADGEIIEHDIKTQHDGEGTLTFLGTGTVEQNIGEEDLALKMINLASASAKTATVTGDVFIQGIDLGLNTMAVTGGYAQTADASIATIANSKTEYGKITATGIATTPADSTITIKVGGYIPNAAILDLISGGEGSTYTEAAGYTVVIDPTGNQHVNFAASQSGNNLILTADRAANGFANDATNPNARAVGSVLDNMIDPSGDMLTVLNMLDAMSPGEVANALDTMTPDVSSGAAEGSRALAFQGLMMIANRLGGARNGGASGSGVSSGDTLDGVGVWMQGLGNHMKQDERKGIQGFSANTFGTTIGADKVIDDHFRAGFAGGYGWAGVHSKQPGSPSDNINSYQATIYGSFDSLDLNKARQSGKKSYEAVRSQVEDSWYVDGMFGFTQNNYDSRREIWLGADKRVAKADHYGQQYSTNFEAGYKFVFEATKNLELTPFLSLGYNYLYMNKYKEKGANSLDLTVNGEGFHQLEQGLGTKLAYPILAKKIGTFIPSAKAAWLYDYIGDRFETTASFAGGGSSFNTRGAKPAKNGMLFGAELAFLNKGNMTVTGNWDIELKNQFVSNTYYGTVRYDF